VAAVATAALARLLPLPRSDATAAATLFSFVVYTVIAIGSFTAPSSLAAWLRISFATAALATALLVFGK